MSAVNGFDVRQAIATISAGEYDDARSYIDVLELVVGAIWHADIELPLEEAGAYVGRHVGRR